MSLLRRSDWSPYLAGAGLGLTAAVSLSFFGKRLSGAGAYQHLSGYLGRAVAPAGLYWGRVMPTGITWEVWLLIGTFLGALASSVLGGTFRPRLMPGEQWMRAFGPSVAKRWLIVFCGTLLIEFAASIAGGCTASLAISGGAVASPGAFLFMAGMFAGGIPAAYLIYRGKP